MPSELASQAVSDIVTHLFEAPSAAPQVDTETANFPIGRQPSDCAVEEFFASLVRVSAAGNHTAIEWYRSFLPGP